MTELPQGATPENTKIDRDACTCPRCRYPLSSAPVTCPECGSSHRLVPERSVVQLIESQRVCLSIFIAVLLGNNLLFFSGIILTLGHGAITAWALLWSLVEDIGSAHSFDWWSTAILAIHASAAGFMIAAVGVRSMKLRASAILASTLALFILLGMYLSRGADAKTLFQTAAAFGFTAVPLVLFSAWALMTGRRARRTAGG